MLKCGGFNLYELIKTQYVQWKSLEMVTLCFATTFMPYIYIAKK